MIFLSPFLDVTKMSMSTVSFLAQLDSEFSAYRMLFLTYDLNGFKSRINKHLLTVGTFYRDFLYAFNALSKLKLMEIHQVNSIRIHKSNNKIIIK